MKTKLALALSLTLPMLANAAITFTPFYGYHLYGDSDVKQKVAIGEGVREDGVALYDDFQYGGAIGLEFSPSWRFELDYQTVDSTKASTDDGERLYGEQELFSGNIVKLFPGGSLVPYLSLGSGLSKIRAETFDHSGVGKTKDTIGNLAAGVEYYITDNFALRGEARAIRNFDHDWWESAALLGLQLKLGTAKPAAPIPVVMPAAPMPAPVAPVVVPPPPAAPADSDKDGVIDAKDKCPGTPMNYVVDSTGCTKMLTQDVSMDVKVLFDTNKADIKSEYLPEVQKVADTMKQYANAVVKIEGHTDSSGGAKLNTALSAKRAEAVKNALVSQYGIEAGRITSAGFGSAQPVVSNATKEGRAQNRRVIAVLTGEKTVPQTK